MPYDQLDPSDLEGDALRRWYQRSPAEIDQERQAARTQQYNDFFGGPRTSEPSAGDPTQPSQSNSWDEDVAPSSQEEIASGSDPFSDDAQAGPFSGGLLAPQLWGSDSTQLSQPNTADDDMTPPGQGASASRPACGEPFFDTTGAGPADGGYLSLIINPAHRRLRREWEKKSGLLWPLDPKTGRKQDVAHTMASADGGEHHIDNIKPMPHDEHMAEHMANDDFTRWGARSNLGRASARMSSFLGPFSVLSDITGLISGRIRTDTPDNTLSDLVGVPSHEDQQKAIEQQQKTINPNWKPGDPVLTYL